METSQAEPTKICIKCSAPKPVAAFSKRQGARCGRGNVCRDCTRKYNRDYCARTHRRDSERERWKNSPERRERQKIRARSTHAKRQRFAYQLRKDFSITVEDWARMYEAQHGRCPGCHRQLLFDPSTVVDHDHDTGAVRGLLCSLCNGALGMVRDERATLLRLEQYLARSEVLECRTG